MTDMEKEPKRVLKWAVPVDDKPHDIGRGEVVLVDIQYDDPATVYVWTEEIGEPIQDRTVQVFGTGQEVPRPSRHVGSVQHTSRALPLVWHVFATPLAKVAS